MIGVYRSINCINIYLLLNINITSIVYSFIFELIYLNIILFFFLSNSTSYHLSFLSFLFKINNSCWCINLRLSISLFKLSITLSFSSIITLFSSSISSLNTQSFTFLPSSLLRIQIIIHSTRVIFRLFQKANLFSFMMISNFLTLCAVILCSFVRILKLFFWISLGFHLVL